MVSDACPFHPAEINQPLASPTGWEMSCQSKFLNGFLCPNDINKYKPRDESSVYVRDTV